MTIELARKRENPSEIAQQVQRKYRLSRPEADAVLRDLAAEQIGSQPLYFLTSTLQMSAIVFLGRPEGLQISWTPRRDRAGEDTQENWQSVERIKRLVQPATPTQRAAYGVVDLAVTMFQPHHVSPLLLVLFGAGTWASLVQPKRRPGLLLTFSVVVVLLTSVTFSWPAPRYRYPVDPLIYVMAAAGLLVMADLVRRGWCRRSRVEE